MSDSRFRAIALFMSLSAPAVARKDKHLNHASQHMHLEALPTHTPLVHTLIRSVRRSPCFSLNCLCVVFHGVRVIGCVLMGNEWQRTKQGCALRVLCVDACVSLRAYLNAINNHARPHTQPKFLFTHLHQACLLVFVFALPSEEFFYRPHCPTPGP